MKGKPNIWESLGYPDMDFDGDVDIVDAILFDELLEEDEPKVGSILDDDDEDNDDFDLDDMDDFD